MTSTRVGTLCRVSFIWGLYDTAEEAVFSKAPINTRRDLDSGPALIVGVELYPNTLVKAYKVLYNEEIKWVSPYSIVPVEAV